jgi:hypothetical protein
MKTFKCLLGSDNGCTMTQQVMFSADIEPLRNGQLYIHTVASLLFSSSVSSVYLCWIDITLFIYRR